MVPRHIAHAAPVRCAYVGQGFAGLVRSRGTSHLAQAFSHEEEPLRAGIKVVDMPRLPSRKTAETAGLAAKICSILHEPGKLGSRVGHTSA